MVTVQWVKLQTNRTIAGSIAPPLLLASKPLSSAAATVHFYYLILPPKITRTKQKQPQTWHCGTKAFLFKGEIYPLCQNGCPGLKESLARKRKFCHTHRHVIPTPIIFFLLWNTNKDIAVPVSCIKQTFGEISRHLFLHINLNWSSIAPFSLIVSTRAAKTECPCRFVQVWNDTTRRVHDDKTFVFVWRAPLKCCRESASL